MRNTRHHAILRLLAVLVALPLALTACATERPAPTIDPDSSAAVVDREFTEFISASDAGPFECDLACDQNCLRHNFCNGACAGLGGRCVCFGRPPCSE